MTKFDLGFEPHEYRSKRPGYRGTSLQAFNRAFPDEEACMAHLFEMRHASNPLCSRCGKRDRWQRHLQYKHYFHPCGGIASPMAGCIFNRTRVPLRLWFYAMLHFANSSESIPTSFLSRQLGINCVTVFRMMTRIRTHMAAIDQKARVGGVGSFVNARIETLRRVINVRHGARNRARVLLLADYKTVISTVLYRPNRSQVVALINRAVTPGSTLITDCYWTHRLLESYGSSFPLAEFKPAFFFKDPPIPDCAKGFTSYFWNSFADQFRGVNLENLWLYLKEYEFRFNRRHSSQKTFWDMISDFPPLTNNDAERLQLANCCFGAPVGTYK